MISKRDLIVSISTVFLMLLLHKVFVSAPTESIQDIENNAASFSRTSDESFERSKKAALEVKKLESKMQKKDAELAQLYSEQQGLEVMKETIAKQKEAIEIRDSVITNLKIENNELSIALAQKDAAYQAQLMATVAYKEAMAEAKLKSGLKGVVLGLGLGLVFGK